MPKIGEEARATDYSGQSMGPLFPVVSKYFYESAADATDVKHPIR